MKAPGPNDFHIAPDGSLGAGLGKDEPDEKDKAAMSSKSAQAMVEMKAQLKELGAELTEKERTLAAREAAIEKVEREQEAERQRLADELDRAERLLEAARAQAREAAADIDGDEQNDVRQPTSEEFDPEITGR